MTGGQNTSPIETRDQAAAYSVATGSVATEHEERIANRRAASLRAATWRLRLFALLNLPMLSAAKPKVRHWDERRIVIVLPFRRRNRSFRGGMAFGPMMMAAECAAGFLFGADIHVRKRRLGWLVTHCEASFTKAMRSEGRFEVCLPEPVAVLLDRAAAQTEPSDFAIDVLGRDSADELCGRYRFTVRIQPWRVRP